MSGPGYGIEETIQAPVPKVKELDPILRCYKNKKALNILGIFKGQEVRIEVKEHNTISFYDKVIKQNRYVSLSPKLMKKFKEVN